MFEKVPIQARPRATVSFMNDEDNNITMETREGEHTVSPDSLIRLRDLLNRWYEVRQKSVEDYKA